jgi:broad specificity phosphatase PhoE
MRIIILRHAKRYGSPLFETSLTPEGLQQAKELVGQLEKIRFDEIYSSPFLRVLQTIYPFCEKYGYKVNIENSFYEALKSDEFTHSNYKHKVHELYEKYPVFKNIIGRYESKLNVANISHVESDIDINNRVSPFIWKLIEKYKDTDKCILIATHQTICNTIKKYFDASVNYNDTFPQGTFEIIDVLGNMQSPASIVYEHQEHNHNAR